MNFQICGWWMLSLQVFLFLVLFSKTRSLRKSVQSYIILSIPILEIIIFFANPPDSVVIFFIIWLVFVVFPTSRNYIAYEKWARIPMYDDLTKDGIRRKDVPRPIVVVIGGSILIEVAWFLHPRWGLIVLWIWAMLHFTALLNRRLRPLAVFTLEYLPPVLAISLVLQCPSWFAIIYVGSFLIPWVWIMKQGYG
ncbi:hypothetical protein [Thermococcus sp.]|uniref:hypothetical protein n=1 Tax=Thermococcus sp. TaxID=35749 RepID=UPI002638C017|nr:hypothetical protein [Thermococcus sp.]